MSNFIAGFFASHAGSPDVESTSRSRARVVAT